MTPIQQLMLGMGAKKKTYMDDVFSTYLYKGNSTGVSNQAINNGIDLSGEGGMVWIKQRTGTYSHNIIDTVRGSNKRLQSNSNSEENTATGYVSQFNSNGLNVGTSAQTNYDGESFSSWTFRKAPGFFDIVSYTGNGSNRTIAHSLGSVPGLIIVKRTDSSADWRVYYRGSDGSDTLKLNSGGDVISSPSSWNSTLPTATHFSLGTQTETNHNGGTFIAYLFAGGESPAATARSVGFSSGKWLETPSSTDYNVGTGDFCIECWVKPTSLTGGAGPYGQPSNGLNLQNSSSNFGLYKGSTAIALTSEEDTPLNQWTHVAATRSSGTIKLFINGTCKKTVSNNNNLDPDSTVGSYVGYGVSGYYNGSVSNLRFVKGSAVYTDSFRPPTEPLTNITNTKLLCCNSSTAGGSTVGSITAYSSPPVSTDSPFDDPAAFTFGDNKEGIIKCGTFTGNGATAGPEINLGWEPQFIITKNINANDHWMMFDSMRGINSNDVDANLYPYTTTAESSASQHLDLTPTGFKIKSNNVDINGNGQVTLYIAIRRPDGYVGKPADAGTGVFAMDTGASSSTIPNFDSGFPVDFALSRQYASEETWYVTARLFSGKWVATNSTSSQSSASTFDFDSNEGWQSNGNNSAYLSWMWKRHAGMDVVTYIGKGVEHHLPHSLSKVPEMIWVKQTGGFSNWMVYHKGLNDGTNPEQKYLELNDNAAIADATGPWNDTAPTSTHFTVGASSGTNGSTDQYMAMLFSSVAGVSKVGYFDGSDSEQTITTGFQPRFLIIKNATTVEDWHVFDTTRGWASGNDNYMKLNSNTAQAGNYDFGAPTSTGFTLTGNNSAHNDAGDKFIYYAHA